MMKQNSHTPHNSNVPQITLTLHSPHSSDTSHSSQISLPYGDSARTLLIPADIPYRTFQYSHADETDDVLLSDISITRQALESPIAAQRLKTLADGKRQVVILISDGSRLCPSHVILPEVINELIAAGIPDQSITVVTALGMHRKHTEDELRRLTGADIYDRIRVINHSPLPEDCVRLGITSLGTPIEINRTVVEADLRIAIGNIEPHGLVGISGGAKAIMPGTSSQHAIESHHSLSGKYAMDPGNPEHPLRKDLEEVLSFVPLHYIVNVVVTHHRRILHAFAGDPIQAHRAGAEAARRIFLIGKQDKYDVVIASTGGHPKDMQLYQAVKTLQNASELCKEGGSIVLLARCEEMFGNGVFQYWVETIQDRSRIVHKLNQQFVLGAHKIKHLDEVLNKHRVFMYSDMPPQMATLAGFQIAHDLQETVDQLFAQYPQPRVAVMPYGALTFPYDA